MPDPIWKRADINATEHRLIWFLLDVGCLGHVADHGWVNKCAEQMGVHRITISRAVKKLSAMGLLNRPSKGNVELNPEGFASTLPEDFIRMKDNDSTPKHDLERSSRT